MRKREGLYYLVNKQATIGDNNIIIAGEKLKGTPGLWELLMSKNPDHNTYIRTDYKNYARIMLKTNVLHRWSTSESAYPKSSKSEQWIRLFSPIWYNRRVYDGKGVVVIPSDPNELLERLDLLLASKKADHTGVGNELVSV